MVGKHGFHPPIQKKSVSISSVTACFFVSCFVVASSRSLPDIRLLRRPALSRCSFLVLRCGRFPPLGVSGCVSVTKPEGLSSWVRFPLWADSESLLRLCRSRLTPARIGGVCCWVEFGRLGDLGTYSPYSSLCSYSRSRCGLWRGAAMLQ